MSADISLRVFTGAGAATMSAAQTMVELTDVDALTGGDVLPGAVSFERWIALRLDTAPVRGATNFWVENTGDLPTGVTLKFGVIDDAATPVNTVSTIATMDLMSGRRYIVDTNVYNAVGELTRFLVIQEVVAIGAASGAIDPQDLQFGWAEA
jgi:hypothetical protein